MLDAVLQDWTFVAENNMLSGLYLLYILRFMLSIIESILNTFILYNFHLLYVQ